MSHARVRRGSALATLVAMVVALLGVLATPAADATTGTLVYSCNGPGFGSAPPYSFQAVVDTDLPATLPFGSQRVTSWTTQLVAPESFRSWAYAQGFTTLYAGARLGTALDGVAQPVLYETTPGLAVPSTPGPWTWSTTAAATNVTASALGHHAFTLTSLEVTVAFHDASGPRLATTATCVLDPGTPTSDTTVDAFDVVAATTSTALTVKGDTATATVTSNGSAPNGTVTFSVGGESVTIGVVAGKASAKLPGQTPGSYTVTAEFQPTYPGQQTSSTGTATYVATRIATTARVSASYRPARHLLRTHARVAADDGSSVTGRVTFVIKRNGRRVDNDTVWLFAHGGANARFHGISTSGRYVVVAHFLGNSRWAPSADRVHVTVR